MTTTQAAPARTRLSRDIIVDALLAEARRSPGAEVSFRTLGSALGVNATAVYRHFRDKDELFRAGVDRLYTEALARVDPAEPSWRARLTQYSDALVEVFLEAPAIGQLAPLIDGRGIGELASIDFAFEALEQAGLDEPQIIAAYSALAGHSLALAAGMAREAGRDGEAGEATPGPAGTGPRPWITALDAHALAQFPRVHARQSALRALSTLDVYRAGVGAILDSISPR